MTIAVTAVLGLLAIAGACLTVDGILQFLGRGTTAGVTESAVDGADGQAAHAGDPSIRIAAPASSWAGRMVQLLLQQADVTLSNEAIAGIFAAACLILLVAAHLLVPFLPFWGQALLAVAAGPGAVIAYLRSRGRKRTEKFMELFPDALDLIVRSLRIGHPVSVAMATVGNEMPEPIGKEFRIVAQQIAYGMSPPRAVDGLAARMAVNDVRFFAVTVQIQYETGGNLSEILESLSAMIRARFQLLRRVKALTAEGRFSAWFLTLLPIAMIFIINFLQPNYYRSVSDFKYYTPIVVTTLLMLVLNAVVARRITRLKV